MPEIFKGLSIGIEPEYQHAIKTLYPYENKFQRLQMLTETGARLQVPMMVLGVLRRRFKSDVLMMIQEEQGLNRIALDRKGRIELGEIVAHPRRLDEDKEKEKF